MVTNGLFLTIGSPSRSRFQVSAAIEGIACWTLDKGLDELLSFSMGSARGATEEVRVGHFWGSEVQGLQGQPYNSQYDALNFLGVDSNGSYPASMGPKRSKID